MAMVSPAAWEWPPNRTRRSSQDSIAAKMSNSGMLRPLATLYSPSTAITIAGRRYLSTRRPAIRPDTPRMNLSSEITSNEGSSPRSSTSPLAIALASSVAARRSMFNDSSLWVRALASSGEVVVRSRKLSMASPMRPAELSLGAIWNDTVSAVISPGSTLAEL